MKIKEQLLTLMLSVILQFILTTADANEGPTVLAFEDHGYVNPFTGGVAWETSNHADVLSMEWAFIGLSEVLPLCSGGFDWTSVDDFLATVDARGHQGILRPIVFGPGYGDENYAPSDLLVNAFVYESTTFDNPAWNEASVQSCILKFIDAFALQYKNDQRVAYIQMGLVGLWGEHHLDGGPYNLANFPSFAFQKTMINHFIDGFGHFSTDLLTALSLDSAQDHGFFSSADTSLDNLRFGFFDDSLLTANHAAGDNWRQDVAPAAQLALHRQHGWGGEAYWSGCNSNGSWTTPPNDCGNGETLSDQAERIGLNYMLGSPAFDDNSISSATLLAASQMMGYKFTATAATRLDANTIHVTVENTGAAFCPYMVEVCTIEGCGGDLSTLSPGSSRVVAVPALAATSQVLYFNSPRLNPNSSQKIRWSNVGADDEAATLTVTVDAAGLIFADGFESIP
ncbi:hypothetical protein [Marinicella litoralis]|uniref:DUF4832 domain-containing protein n=1 Tax=Marinicella litoralis TaxID=644220 RepID=A0A4R6XB26_9GAMM|nr:hypothetical protein [Marinicella litoralis]TDR16366.1 hypothetical protein C8D91_2893 [Marinicella litoralis]